MSQNEADAVFCTKGKCLHLRLNKHPHQPDELAITAGGGTASGASAESLLDAQHEAPGELPSSRVPASLGHHRNRRPAGGISNWRT